MAITRKFIDWKNPALQSAVEFLHQRYASEATWDLDQVVIVVPGSRAGRRLLEQLIAHAERESLVFLPPQITTVGRLPEMLYEPKRPFASKLIQMLAWVRALRDMPRQRLEEFIPQLPPDGEVARWIDLGQLLWRQHRELAAEAMDFSDVVAIGSQMSNFQEHSRWQLLRQVQQRYLQLLDDLGLWDLQTARLFAIEHGECHTSAEIILLATADMNRAMRLMLDQVGDRVVALVHAPNHVAGRFDKHGCIDPTAWQKPHINIDRQQVRVADGPVEVAVEVARQLNSYQGKYRADQVSIGVPDERLAPFIQRQLQQSGVPTRLVAGARIADTSPYRLLRILSDFVARRRYAEFAALVRHPDVYDWVMRQVVPRCAGGVGRNAPAATSQWLADLDAYHQKHLQPRLGQWLGEPGQHSHLREIHHAVDSVVQELHGPDRQLNQWADVLLGVLSKLYQGVELDRSEQRDQVSLSSFHKIREVLLEFSEVPRDLTPTISATQAVSLLLDLLSSEHIGTVPDSAAVELLGWLELPLDQASALIVTSMNERFVPKSANSDLFLPNSLRQRLGLVDNARRYARDAYALSVLVASRENLTLVVSRRDTQGDPLVPSRLLFASTPETIARRVLAFFDRESEQHQDQPPTHKPPDRLSEDGAAAAPSASKSAGSFVVPKPRPLATPVNSMSVTSFRTYLACPYRFYLRHVLRLESLHDRAMELDAAAFGTVLHEVLSRFGASDVSQSTQEAEIRAFLRHTLKRCIEEWYGKDVLPAVNVQVMQIQSRLDAFAEWQAEWAGRGWRIRYTEVPEQGQIAKLATDDGRIMRLHGRLDRVDHNPETGEWFIFDYKTSNSVRTPNANHIRSRQWVDLQLPFYRHLADLLSVPANARLGYIVLPRDTSKVGELEAEWSSDQLAAADQLAAETARRVLDEQFWPPNYPVSMLLEEFAPICQDDVFERHLEAAEV